MKSRTKRKNIKYKRLEKENGKYQEIVKELQNKIIYDDYLKKENEKLIEWVQKILEQFGTFDVNSRERIQIPIMKKSDNWSDGLHNEPITTETIAIPEIIISKMNYREKMKEYLKEPDEHSSQWGKWGILNYEQRRLIKRLLEEMDRADEVIKHQYFEIERLNNELEVAKTNEETYRLEMLDITKRLGLDEETLFDDVKDKAERLNEELKQAKEIALNEHKYASEMEDKYITANNIINELEKWIKEILLSKAYSIGYKEAYKDIYMKLQELKGSVNDE